MLPKRLCQIGKTFPLIPRVDSLSLVAGFSWISAAVLREYSPCLFTAYRWLRYPLTPNLGWDNLQWSGTFRISSLSTRLHDLRMEKDLVNIVELNPSA